MTLVLGPISVRKTGAACGKTDDFSATTTTS